MEFFSFLTAVKSSLFNALNILCTVSGSEIYILVLLLSNSGGKDLLDLCNSHILHKVLIVVKAKITYSIYSP